MKDLCSSIYRLRVWCMLDELLALLLAPFLLCFCLPAAADDICDCIYACTVSTPFGDLCCFSGLDVAAYGSKDYAPPPFLQQQQQQQQQQRQKQKHKKDEDKVGRLGREGESSSMASSSSSAAAASSSSSCFSKGIATPGPSLETAGGVHTPGGGPSAPAVSLLQRFLPTGGKIEKSAISFLLTYRIAAPHDDTSPLWAVLASRKLTRSLIAASARSIQTFILYICIYIYIYMYIYIIYTR